MWKQEFRVKELKIRSAKSVDFDAQQNQHS